jgi:hypothetical protein
MATDGDWRRFSFTVRVILASALAQEEAMALRRAVGTERFAFRLLAAATSQQAALPGAGWFDATRTLRATCSVKGDEIRLQLQAEGFSALQRVARRPASLVAENGSFNLAIGFDGNGRALAVLTDADAVREGLSAFELVIDPS